MILLKQSEQKLVQYSELSGRANQFFHRCGVNVGFGSVEQIGVQAAFAELHHQVGQEVATGGRKAFVLFLADITSVGRRSRSQAITHPFQCRPIFHEQRLVPEQLCLGQWAIDLHNHVQQE